MPYKNIVLIKLFLRLFEEDDRFLYQLNESQQLLFIKMLYLSAITDNKIPKNPRFICSKINYHHEEECLFKDLDRILEVFNGFKTDGKSYHFNNFHELHNYTGKHQGNPTPKGRVFPDKDKSKSRVRVEQEKIKKKRREEGSYDPVVCDMVNKTVKSLSLGGK